MSLIDLCERGLIPDRLTDDETSVVSLITEAPLHVDEIARTA